MKKEDSFIDYGNFKAYSFHCMGGLCEVLVESANKDISDKIFNQVAEEARRLEKKFSRYNSDNIVYKINHAQGRKVKIDSESFQLLKFADTLYQASRGLFDITSGVLRKAWTFDGRDVTAEAPDVNPLLSKLGWKQVCFDKKSIQIPNGFEIDFGGVGKEYAVDSCKDKADKIGLAPTLVNLGGDIAVTGPKKDGCPWKVAVDQSKESVALFSGGVATSGDKNRFVMFEGRRLSHILNPKTGWPIEGAPRSVTVYADTCTEAGALSTLSLLQGADCEKFLKQEADQFKVIW